MKKTFLCLLISLFISAIDAQDPAFEWVDIIGGANDQEGHSVTVDESGDIYFVGNYKGTVDFDPGEGILNLVSVDGSSDVFIQKLDAERNLIWARSVGGIGPDGEYMSVTTDAWGNVIISGGFQGTADFDPGNGTYLLSSHGHWDYFVLKLNSEGEFLWATATGGDYWDRSYGIATDPSGSVIITGYYSIQADFDPGEGIFYLPINVDNDAFIQKLDSDGNFLWAIGLGSAKEDAGKSVTTDSYGNIYTTGTFWESIDFDPGPGSFNINTKGTTDAYIQKLDPDGNLVWAGSVGGTHRDYAGSIFSDEHDQIYVSGKFTSSVVYVDLGTGIHEVDAEGYGTAFLLKVDSDANILWTRALGGTDMLSIYSIVADTEGNVYTSGSFSHTADFDPGEGTFNLSAGNYNPFIQKLDSEGDFVWAGCLYGTTSLWEKQTIITDTRGNIYLASTFNDEIDMDPGEGVHDLIAYHYDGYLLKLSQCVPNTGTDVIEACDSFTWIDGINYTKSNNRATHVLTNAGGCDSVVTLDLSINHPTAGTDVIEACDSYTWIDGITYTSSNNTAMHVLTNETGCDSLVTLDLGINHSSTGTDVIKACDNFTWIDGITYTESNHTATHVLSNEAGCDSIVSLDLTIAYPTYITDQITACDSITWMDGTTYTESNNTATHTLTGAAGCDSTVLLDLTIFSVDASVTVIGSTVTAVLAGAEYQWIDCINFNAVIEGEIDQSFTPTASGSYAVEVTKGACAKTSACVPITVEEVGVGEDPLFGEISFFPNPAKGWLNIELGSLSDVGIIIYDMEGRVIFRQEHVQGPVAQVQLQAEPSLYLVEINAMGKKQVYKLMIE